MTNAQQEVISNQLSRGWVSQLGYTQDSWLSNIWLFLLVLCGALITTALLQRAFLNPAPWQPELRGKATDIWIVGIGLFIFILTLKYVFGGFMSLLSKILH